MNKGMTVTSEQEQIELTDDIQATPHNEETTPTNNQQTLSDSVKQSLNSYFDHLDGQMVTDLYELVLSQVEAPLLESVLKHTGNNQSKTAEMLGLNRGTLRKKLKKYGYL